MDLNVKNHHPLREIVYEELKKRIMTGEIKPGTRLMEIGLADDMGVSRTPIREAIRKLEKEGLVTIEPRRGAYASDVSVADMVNLLVVREDLESLAARLAASRISDEEIAALEDVSKDYAEAIQNNDTERMIACDEDFHKKIVAATGNKTLIRFSGTTQELALRFRYLYYDDFARYQNMPSEHRAILDALKSGDAAAAGKAAEAHVESLKYFVEHADQAAFHGKKHKPARKK